MFTKYFTTAVLATFALFAQSAYAEEFTDQLDEVSGYAKNVDELMKDVSEVKLKYVILDKNEAIHNLLESAYFWTNAGYEEYAKTRMYGVRARASEMRDAAFDLYYSSSQDRRAAYYTWFYAQSMMLIADEVVQSLDP